MLIKHFMVLISVYPSLQFFFTSISKTKELINVETQMLVELGDTVEEADLKGEPITDEIRQFYFNAKRENLKAISIPSFIENPLNSYHFIKRMYKQWTRLVSLISCDGCGENPVLSDLNFRLMKVEERSKVNPADLEGDYNGALVGLVRLWRTYKLDISKLIQGWIKDERGEPLDPEDVFAVCAVLENNLHEEKQWIEAMLEIQNQNGAEANEISKSVRALASVLWKIGLEQQAISVLKDQLDEDPANKNLKTDVEFYEAKFTEGLHSHNVFHVDDGDSIIEQLCRGEGTRDIKIVSKLKCINRGTSIPVYFAKEEILNMDPRVAIMHDVVYPSEIAEIKQFAAKKLADSEVMNPDGSGSVATTVRVSQTTWIGDAEHPTVARVNARVQLITGLSTRQGIPLEHSEQLQVLNYGFGGMYIPHLDQVNHTLLPNSADQRGERMATWMFYLNDIKLGGATVFPKLNITVPVTKWPTSGFVNPDKYSEENAVSLLVQLTNKKIPGFCNSKFNCYTEC